ncbi:hypothetical protein ACPXB3_21535 [Gordonia sp. DT219]|uniref:hypothetical protein n=1 Tax=Gordonia sp. DT219 TaxID=3416658 RepID=UPI003CE68B9E
MGDLNWIGEKALARIEEGAREGVRQAGEAILAESNRRAPRDSGELISSGRVATDGTEAAIGYSAPYAARQHEALGYNHPHGGQAKFLETAVHVAKDEALDAVANAIREALGG